MKAGMRVLVTGASSGIGAATAKLLDSRGASLALSARSVDGLARVAGGLRGEPVIAAADVRDRTELDGAVALATERLGGLDAVVVAAAGTAFGPFREIPAEDFDATIETTLIGAVNTIRATLEPVERSGGTIVVVGSIAGRAPMPLMSPYVTAKHGLRGLVRSLRIELREDGSPVSICLVDPGPVDTPFWDHVRSFDGLLPPRFSGVYRADDVAAEVVARIERGGGDSTVGGLMELWRLADQVVPPLTERVIGFAAGAVMKLDRRPARETDSLEGPAGEGDVSTGMTARPSVLVAARSVLSRIGVPV